MNFRLPALAFFGAALLFATAGFSEPGVWMLSPGFTVRELPIKLTNVNNLRFTTDGRLTALGYDGRIHFLTDTDGDGLEDTDTLFWDKPTLSVPVGMAWSKDGLYVSSHGKISLLRDSDHDGKADVEETIARGWPPTDVASGGVDATAVTLDQAGNIYFGLLTANYVDPYRVKDGVSHYDLNSPRGTIQKWSVATKRLEAVATGIRVPYTLAFNRHGDLFVTDQEGATWCPDGNPLDELNHIIPGRNYGFPPRHEKHLPNLISEPPVVGFGPQHQSTCGMVFNEPSSAQARFGPAEWDGDALVAGQSRGKIWRVRLVKTAGGYLGKETTIARLNLLTLDLAISPAGDLYVACHSGEPDWGTGPKGEGTIFKISFADATAPQPTAIWTAGPQEVRVAFDRPIEASTMTSTDEIKIESGDFVSAADRLETLRPTYKVVQSQQAAARGKLRVVAARLSPDRRTLALTTDPHPQSVAYALTLPGIKAADTGDTPATVDLAYDLHGVEATWWAGGAAEPAQWQGWLPHLNSDVNARFTVRSAEHEQLAELLARPGQLRLRTQVWLPAGATTLRLSSPVPFEVSLDAHTAKARAVAAGLFNANIDLNRNAPARLLVIDLATGSGFTPLLQATYLTGSDSTERPVPFAALLLPWASPTPASRLVEHEEADLAGGDFERGRALFHGTTLGCATCHRVRQAGNTLGPDLSNLAHRDAASVLRDIKEPSATINPDYVAYVGELKGGGSFAGFVRAHDSDTLRITGMDGQEQQVRRSEVTDLRTSPVSLMPPGLVEGCTEGEIRDLLIFLLNAPPTRTKAELAAVSRAGPAGTASTKPLNIVLVASQQDHGPGQHDYPAWQKKWLSLLTPAPGVRVVSAWDWPSPEQWRTADAMVFNFRNPRWSVEQYHQLDAFQQRGGGIVLFHAATIADREPEKLAARFGLAAQPGPTNYRHMPLTLNFSSSADDVITHGFTTLNLLDEPYWPMFGDPKLIHVLATADVDGASRPLLWTFEKGTGRVFASIPGHYTWTFDDPLFEILALRGLAWVCRESPSRFER